MAVNAETYFKIDKTHKLRISTLDFDQYKRESRMSNKDAEKWHQLFKDKVVSLEDVVSESGEKYDQVIKNNPDKTDVTTGVQIVNTDMLPETREVCLKVIQDAIDLYTNDQKEEIVQHIKRELDYLFGELWHVNLVEGRYYSFHTHVAGFNLVVIKDNVIYMMHRTESKTP